MKYLPLVLLVSFTSTLPAAESPNRPNIVLVMADDQGWGDTGYNGKSGDKNTKSIPGRAILASDPLSPGKLGFDEWVSADNFFDLDPVLGRNGVPEKFHGDSSDVTTDEALKFIRKQAGAGQPFLAVVWFGSPHVPHEALPADKAAYAALPEKDQNYYGELTAVDRSVGPLTFT